MRILESVAVLIVFFILLAISSSVYFGIQNSQLDKERLVFENAEAFRAIVKLQSLPELDCSFASAHTINCFDKYKIKAFSEAIQDESVQEFYFPIFGEATININISGPVEEDFVIYDIKPVKFRSAIKKIMPVLVYDPVTARYYFGLSELVKYA